MSLKKLLTLLVVSVILSGCVTTNEIRSVDTSLCYTKPPLNIPNQAGLTLDEINVIVEQLPDGTVKAFLDDNAFETIIKNNLKVEGYIRTNNQIIQEYKEYYEGSE